MNMTQKSLVATVIALIVASSLIVIGFTVGYSQAKQDAEKAPALPTCTTEDSTNCVWDARIHGNGEGRSFVDLNGHTYFLEK